MTKKRIARKQDALRWLERAKAAAPGSDERERFRKLAWVEFIAADIHEQRGDVDDRRGRPKGSKGPRGPRIDDTKAREFMRRVSADTGEHHGETLAAAAWDAGFATGQSKVAAKKRLAKWWRTEAKKLNSK